MRATPRSSSTACHAAPLPRGGVHGRKAPKCVGAAPQRVAPSHTALDPGEAVARAHGIERSAHWPGVAHAHLQLEPRCVCCGSRAELGQAVQVHHVFPFHCCVARGRPDPELDLRNLITLCQSERGRPEEDHHLRVGHLDWFESSNLEVRRDAERVFRGKGGAEIRASRAWKERAGRRLKPLRAMTDAEKRAFVKEMNRRLLRR